VKERCLPAKHEPALHPASFPRNRDLRVDHARSSTSFEAGAGAAAFCLVVQSGRVEGPPVRNSPGRVELRSFGVVSTTSQWNRKGVVPPPDRRMRTRTDEGLSAPPFLTVILSPACFLPSPGFVVRAERLQTKQINPLPKGVDISGTFLNRATGN